MDSFFNQLQRQTLSKKAALLKQLKTSERNNIHKDPQKPDGNELISESVALVLETQNTINAALTKCHELIQTSVNEKSSKEERQQQLQCIYDEALQEYTATNQRLKQTIHCIKQAIRKNESYAVFPLGFYPNHSNAVCLMKSVNSLQLTNPTEGVEEKEENIEIEEGNEDNEEENEQLDMATIDAQKRIIADQRAEIKIFKVERKQHRIEQQRNQSTIASQKYELSELDREIRQSEKKIQSLKGKMTALRKLNPMQTKPKAAIATTTTAIWQRKQPQSLRQDTGSGFVSWKQYVISKLKTDNVSVLNEYANETHMKIPRYSYQQKNANHFVCTMHFGGFTLIGEDTTKNKSRWNCVLKYVHNYM